LRLVRFHRFFFFFSATTSFAGDKSTSLYDLFSFSLSPLWWLPPQTEELGLELGLSPATPQPYLPLLGQAGLA
jgi:hypothetical protein